MTRSQLLRELLHRYHSAIEPERFWLAAVEPVGVPPIGDCKGLENHTPHRDLPDDQDSAEASLAARRRS